MSMLAKLLSLLDRYREVAFDLLRIYLGVGLFVRGVLFFYDPSAYTALVPPEAADWMTASALLYAVALIHLVGGAMMALGLLTRLAALTQIPILLGAVFVAQLQGGLFATSQSFEFSALVLFLLLLIFLYGSGDWSLDHRLQRRNLFQSISENQDTYREVGYALLRFYLGVGLLVRGMLFIADSSTFILQVPAASSTWLTSVLLIHVVALIHLAGGTMMALGLLTRLAALIQIPILIGAVFVAQLQGGLLTDSQSFEFSALVLFLLVLIFLYGSGIWSADQYIMKRSQEEEPGPAARSPRAEAILNRPDAGVPAGVTSEGGVAVAERAAVATLTCPLSGTCPVTESDLPREHEWVIPEAKYSVWGWFLFTVNVTPDPKEIAYRCRRCSQVIDRSRTPRDLEQYRYR